MKRLALIVLLFLSFQSCSQAKKSVAKTEPAPAAPIQSTEAKAPPEKYSPGESLKNTLMAINLKNPKDKAYNMKEFVNTRKKNIIVLVKEGCVFCNSLVALMANKKFDANLLMVADNHTSFAQFVKKSKDYKSIKGQWLYDYEGDFATKLGMHSYPNILVLDKDLNVIEHQKGLRMLKDKQQLEGLSFAAALQSMALNTVNWLGQI